MAKWLQFRNSRNPRNALSCETNAYPLRKPQIAARHAKVVDMFRIRTNQMVEILNCIFVAAGWFGGFTMDFLST